MTSSSRPLPHLPLETQAGILRFCDLATLAVSSRVCLAWLELAGPILYEHITVRGKDQLEMMIRSESVLASIAPFVSLDQTKSFTYMVPDTGFSIQDVSSPLCSSPVAVERLHVDLRDSEVEITHVNIDLLLCSFNPTHFSATSRPTDLCRVGRYFNLPNVAWTDLQLLTFTHALSYISLAYASGLGPTTSRPDLVYDMSDRHPREEDDLVDKLSEVSDDLRTPLDPTLGTAFGHVQVWVHDEEEVKLAKTRLVGCSYISLDIGVKEPVESDA